VRGGIRVAIARPAVEIALFIAFIVHPVIVSTLKVKASRRYLINHDVYMIEFLGGSCSHDMFV
jgi:hypothetical protein